MARRIESHWIAGPAGRLEALLEEPEEGPRLAVVICHPHPLFGGTMRNKVAHRLARGVRRAGAAALRFNFRGVELSEGSHGDLEGEIEDARAAAAWLRERYPSLPFALAGFSFGALVVSRLACEGGGPRWMIAAGFPTRHGPTDYLEGCAVPRIFIQSTHDQYGPRAELEAMYARLEGPKRLAWVEAADHFFAGALDEFEERVVEAAGSGA